MLILNRFWSRQPPAATPLQKGAAINNRLNFCWVPWLQTQDLAEGLPYKPDETAGLLSLSANPFGIGGRGGASQIVRFQPDKTYQATEYTALAVVIDDTGRGAVRSPIDADDPSEVRVWQLRLDADNKVRGIVFNTASSNFQPSGGTAVPADNLPHVIALRLSGTTATTWLDGVQQGSATVTGTPRTLGVASVDIAVGGKAENTSSQNYPGQILLAAHWARPLSDAEMVSVAKNPWQLFAPRRVFVPINVVAGGLPTLSLSTYKPGTLTSTGWTPRVTAS